MHPGYDHINIVAVTLYEKIKAAIKRYIPVNCTSG